MSQFIHSIFTKTLLEVAIIGYRVLFSSNGGKVVEIALLIMLAAALFVLFFCGYYVGVIKEKWGKNWLLAVPITVSILMFNIVLAVYELTKARWG